MRAKKTEIIIKINVSSDLIATQIDLANLIRRIGACVHQGKAGGFILNEETKDETSRWTLSLDHKD